MVTGEMWTYTDVLCKAHKTQQDNKNDQLENRISHRWLLSTSSVPTYSFWHSFVEGWGLCSLPLNLGASLWLPQLDRVIKGDTTPLGSFSLGMCALGALSWNRRVDGPGRQELTVPINSLTGWCRSQPLNRPRWHHVEQRPAILLSSAHIVKW